MAKAFDVGFTSEPSFAKATDGRGSAVSIVQTLAECRERGGRVLTIRLGAERGAERVVEVRSALRGRDGVATRPLASPTGASLRSRLPFEA